MKEKVGLSLNFYFGEQIFLRVFANTENRDCVVCTGWGGLGGLKDNL